MFPRLSGAKQVSFNAASIIAVGANSLTIRRRVGFFYTIRAGVLCRSCFAINQILYFIIKKQHNSLIFI